MLCSGSPARPAPGAIGVMGVERNWYNLKAVPKATPANIKVVESTTTLNLFFDRYSFIV